jgi:uncharacterized membrane protein YfcA
LVVGAKTGSPVGALALSVVPSAVARIVIAAIIAAAVVMLVREFSIATVPSRLATTFVGLVSGLFNGLAAMPGPPVLIYDMFGPFDSVAARASLLTFFLITSIPAMLGIASVGLIDKSMLTSPLSLYSRC